MIPVKHARGARSSREHKKQTKGGREQDVERTIVAEMWSGRMKAGATREKQQQKRRGFRTANERSLRL